MLTGAVVGDAQSCASQNQTPDLSAREVPSLWSTPTAPTFDASMDQPKSTSLSNSVNCSSCSASPTIWWLAKSNQHNGEETEQLEQLAELESVQSEEVEDNRKSSSGDDSQHSFVGARSLCISLTFLQSYELQINGFAYMLLYIQAT